MTQYYDQIVALSQSILDYWAVSQELRDAVLKKRVDSRVRSQAIDIQTQMQSFNFFFGVQLGVLVLRHNSQLILYFTIHTHVHVILKSTVNCKKCFLSLQRMREEPSFRIFFERFRASKWKLEIDDPKPPKKRKVLRHYAEGEAPVEFVSTVEEHYHHIFISA